MFQTTKFPVTEWFTDLALYQPVDYGTSSPPAVKAILTYTGKLDFYCPECQKSATFEGVLSAETQNSMASEIMATKSFGFASGFWTQHIFSKQLACTRAGHLANFYFQIQNGKLYKVGQQPAIADIHIGEMQPYLSVLGLDRVKRLEKAISLAANGDGLGSYIYLKQLFLSLLSEMDAIEQSDNPNDQAIRTMEPVVEKIQRLASRVPSFLIEHPELYAMIDEPLETLTDDTCLKHFKALNTAVYFLIDAKLAEAQYLARQREATSE